MNKKQMIMKKLFIVLVVGLMWAACTREEVDVFSLEDNYIYFSYDNGTTLATSMVPDDSTYYFYNKSSLTVKSTQQRDTFYFEVRAAGLAKSVDRQIKIAPWSCEVSGFTEAVEGVNYVPFDDPEMVENLVLPADSVRVKIPVIVTYDPSIAGTAKSFIVGLKLVDSGDLKVMGTNLNITIADKAARTHAYVRFNQSSL